jgi:arylsulfatase A-like enzyme
VIDHPAALLDLTATWLDYAGAKPLPGMQSRTLRHVLEGRASRVRDAVTSGLRAWRAAFDGRYKLIRGAEPEVQLYDLRDDPVESVNLAGKMPQHVHRLSAYLAAPAG